MSLVNPVLPATAALVIDQTLGSTQQERLIAALNASIKEDGSACVEIRSSGFSDIKFIPNSGSRQDGVLVAELSFKVGVGFTVSSNAMMSKPHTCCLADFERDGWHGGTGQQLSATKLLPPDGIKISLLDLSDPTKISTTFLVLPLTDWRLPNRKFYQYESAIDCSKGIIAVSSGEASSAILGSAPHLFFSGGATKLLTCVAGGIGTSPCHARIEKGADSLRIQDLGSTRGFWISRENFGHLVQEYHPPNGATSISGGDRIWLGGSPALGLSPSLVVPSTIKQTPVNSFDLGTLVTTESLAAFHLFERLELDQIAVSPTMSRACKITLLCPQVRHQALIVRRPEQDFSRYILKPALPDGNLQWNLRIHNLEYGERDIRQIRPDSPPALMPTDTVFCADGDKVWFQVPGNPSFHTAVAKRREDERERAHLKKALQEIIQETFNREFGRLVTNQIASSILKSEVGAPGENAVILPQVQITADKPLVMFHQGDGTFLLRGTAGGRRFRTGVAVLPRNSRGGFETEQQVSESNPVVVIPGDKIVFVAKSETGSRLGEIYIDVPNNEVFGALPETWERRSVPANDEHQSLVATGTIATVFQPGQDKVSISYLRSCGLQPESKFKVGNVKFEVSTPFIMDGGGRVAVVAIVSSENRRALRLFYTSISQTFCRLLPAINREIAVEIPEYDKAGDEHFLTLHPDVQAPLMRWINVQFSAGKVIDLSHSQQTWQRTVRINCGGEGLLDYWKDDKLDPSKGAGAPIFSFTHQASLEEDQRRIAPFDLSLIPEHLRPNYNGGAISKFEFTPSTIGPSRLYGGPIQYFVYPSTNGELLYTVVVAPRGRVFVGQICAALKPGDDLTTFGLTRSYVDGGSFTMPGCERPAAIPDTFGHLRIEHVYKGYWDMFNVLAKNQLIQLWQRYAPEGRGYMARIQASG